MPLNKMSSTANKKLKDAFKEGFDFLPALKDRLFLSEAIVLDKNKSSHFFHRTMNLKKQTWKNNWTQPLMVLGP